MVTQPQPTEMQISDQLVRLAQTEADKGLSALESGVD